MSHPWIWLNEPQHSAAVSALATIVQTFTALLATAAAIIAAIYAKRAFVSTRGQLRVMHAQLELERKKISVETARLEQEHQAETHRKTAEEDAKRPRWDWSGFGNGTQWFMTVANCGTLEAIDVRIEASSSGKLLLERDHMAPRGANASIVMDNLTYASGVIIRYRTAYGSYWCVLVTPNQPEKVLEVTRGY